jgi:hypothetical protein
MNILTQPLWRDEAFTAAMILRDPLEIIRLTAGDATPPLHYLTLYFWSYLFGNSEVSLRALGVIFFLATACVMYLIGERLGKGTGLWLALLTLTQPFLFNYAFEARAYSLLVLLACLTIYFYLRKLYLPMGLAGAAMLYTHLFGLWVVGILIGFMLYRREPWLWMGLPILLHLPWLPNYLNFARVAGNFLSPPNLSDLLRGTFQLGLAGLVPSLPFLKKVSSPHLSLAAALTVIPILGTFIISQIRPVFIERYLIVAVVGELLILGLALGQASFRRVAILLIIVQAILSAYIFSQPTKPPFGELASYIKERSAPGDVVLNGSSLTYFESQYYGLDGQIYSPHNDVPYYVGKVLIPDSDIKTAPPPATRYWLINLDEPGGTLSETFPGQLIAERSFGRLRLSLYEPPTP